MRYSPSLASFVAATSIALATLASPRAALAADGDSDHVLLSSVGLEFDVPPETGSWVVTPINRGNVRGDGVVHDAQDGTQTRMAVTIGEGRCEDVLRAAAERGSRFVRMPWPANMPGLHPEAHLASNRLLTVCMDTYRGSLTITTGAINNTTQEPAARTHTALNEHGQFIAYIYFAARRTFGIVGVDPAPVQAHAASAAPSPAPSNSTSPAGYTLVPISGFGYTPVAPPTSGVGFYTNTVGYAPSSQQVLYGMPSAYLPNTQARIVAIHAQPERTMPFGFGAGLSLGAGFGVRSHGAAGARAVLVLGGRAPSAFEFGVRTVFEYGWDRDGETGEIGAAAYAAIHPLALARHYRFDPSLYAAAGYSGVAGMGRNTRLPFTGAVTATGGVAVDVRVRRGFHMGVYAEFETVTPTIDSGIWVNDARSFFRASAGIRIMGWGMR